MPKSWRQQKGIVVGDPKGIDWDFIWEDQIQNLYVTCLLFEHVIFKFELIASICCQSSELLKVHLPPSGRDSPLQDIFLLISSLDVQISSPVFLRTFHISCNYMVKYKLTSCIYSVLRINDLSFQYLLPYRVANSLKLCFNRCKKCNRQYMQGMCIEIFFFLLFPTSVLSSAPSLYHPSSPSQNRLPV